MPYEIKIVSAVGIVTDLFGHRFVITTAEGKILADLGPKAAELIALAIGDRVVLLGEKKPTEVKVHCLTRGDQTVQIRSEKHDRKHEFVDPTLALAAVKAAGFEAFGVPKRKPKHFEIIGHRGDEHVEFHVEPDGQIRKTKPASRPELRG